MRHRETDHNEYAIARDAIGRGEVDAVVADLRVQTSEALTRRSRSRVRLFRLGVCSRGRRRRQLYRSQLGAPEERLRIRELLRIFPRATGKQRSRNSCVVLEHSGSRIAARGWSSRQPTWGPWTSLGREIDRTFPGQGWSCCVAAITAPSSPPNEGLERPRDLGCSCALGWARGH